MNILDNSMTILFAIWILMMLKNGYDSIRFRTLYLEKIDPTFPPSASEMDWSIMGQIRNMKRSWSIPFSKYPEHPDVDKYARRVRGNVFAAIGLLIIFIVLGVLDPIVAGHEGQ